MWERKLYFIIFYNHIYFKYEIKFLTQKIVIFQPNIKIFSARWRQFETGAVLSFCRENSYFNKFVIYLDRIQRGHRNTGNGWNFPAVVLVDHDHVEVFEGERNTLKMHKLNAFQRNNKTRPFSDINWILKLAPEHNGGFKI